MNKANLNEGEWGVWCVSAGMLGHREAWLKTEINGCTVIARFPGEAEAGQRAAKIMAGLSPNSPTMFRYYARRLDEVLY